MNRFSYCPLSSIFLAAFLATSFPVTALAADGSGDNNSNPSGTMLLPLSPKLDVPVEAPVTEKSTVSTSSADDKSADVYDNNAQPPSAVAKVKPEQGSVNADNFGDNAEKLDENATLKGTIQIVADDTEFDQNKNTFLGTGNAVALIGGQNSKLQADSILYDQNNQMIDARGNVSILRNGQLTTGSSFKFNVTSDEYLITQPETMIDNTQVVARKSVGTKTGVAFKEGTMSMPVPFWIAKNFYAGPMSYREEVMAQKAHPDAYLPEHASFKFKANKMVYERYKEQGNFTIFGGRIEFGDFSIPVGTFTCTVGKTETKAVFPVTPYIGNNMYTGGINVGPQFNTGIGQKSTLSWSPLVQFGGTSAGGTSGSGSSIGIGGRVAFYSPTWQTHLAYGSNSNLLVGDIKARVWRKVRFQSGINRFLNDGMFGLVRARLAAELVNSTSYSNIPYLANVNLRTSAGWYQDNPQLVNISSTYAALHGNPTQTQITSAFKAQQQIMVSTHPFFNVGDDRLGLKGFLYGGAAARGYSTGNTNFITQLSPILDAHLTKYVRMQTGYTTSTVNGSSPFVFDEYIQGTQSVFLQGDVKLSKYVSIGGYTGYNMSQKLYYAKQVVAAIGPPDVKFVIGKDFILNNYRFGFNLLYGDPIQYNKLVFKGTPDQGQLGNSAGGI
jgi:lipopolysaccharide export system protein LptA